jgi:hypothetical protein
MLSSVASRCRHRGVRSLLSWPLSLVLPMSFASAHYRQEVDGLRVRSNTKSAIFELIDVADLSTLRSSAETYATKRRSAITSQRASKVF